MASPLLKKLLREPLLHFLLLGACLFLIAGLRRGAAPLQFGRAQPQTAKIVIAPGDVESLIASFNALWQRPPTPQELNGLIEGRVREEVYYREALKLGLDRDDAIIRSRLQEKLEFLSQDIKEAPQPSEQDLATFLAQHPELFRAATKYSFRLVFVDAGLHGAETTEDAEKLLARLGKNAQPDTATKGDPLPFSNTFEGVTESDVVKQLGNAFAAALASMETGKWSGPVKTQDGAYLVYVKQRVEGRLPALAEIQPAVQKEWLAAQRRAANDKYYQGLLQRYAVSVELPKGIRADAGNEAAPK